MNVHKSWVLISFLSAVGTVGVVALAFLLPSYYAVGLLLLGTGVFIFVLARNPAYRFRRLAATVIGAWLAGRILPSLALRMKWRDDLFVDLWLSQEMGWSFDVGAVILAIVLVVLDFALHHEGGGWLGRRVKVAPEKQYSSGGTPNQLQIDVSGTGHTVNITQNQSGPSAEEIARLVQTAPWDANGDIDLAAGKIQDGKPDIAIFLLTDLRRRRWDLLKPRERYRLVANLAHAHERKGELRTAGLMYLESATYQPGDEQARCREAIGYALLGDSDKAFGLAGNILKEFPLAALAVAVRVRCASDDMSFTEVEGLVPSALRDHVEVLHALALRAAKSNDLAAAERLAREGAKACPEVLEFQQQLGAVLVRAEGKAAFTGERLVSKSRLEEAVAALSKAIEKAHGKIDIARLRHNRAEAFVLLGQAGDAETDFRTAVDMDPADQDMARRFAIFLESQGRDDAAIEVLRRIPGEQLTAASSLILASLLGARAKPGDRPAAVGLLRQRLPKLAAEEPGLRSGLVTTLVNLYLAEGNVDEATLVLDSLPTGVVSPLAVQILRVTTHRRAGRKDEAVALSRQAYQDMPSDAPEDDRLRLAEQQFALGEYRDALALLKPFAQPVRPDYFVRMALEAAKQCGDDDYILAVGAQLRANGVLDPYCLELEVVAREKYGPVDEAVAIMQGYLKEPSHDNLARVFRARLSMIGLTHGRPELVETDPSRLPAIDEIPVRMGGSVAYILKNGPDPTQGVFYAYSLLRKNFFDADARHIYYGVMGADDEMSNLFPKPESVTSGCAVMYQADDSAEEKWVVIEDGPNATPDKGEIPPGDPLAREMMGRSVGDKIYLRRDPIQNRTATIRAITSKYVYRKFEIINTWEDLFRDRFLAKKYDFGSPDDTGPDLGLFFQFLSHLQHQADELRAYYRDNHISVSTFALLQKSSLLETFFDLATGDPLPIRCSQGSVDELQQGLKALEAASTVVLDPSALATLFLSGHCEVLAKLPYKFVVCENSLDEYRDLQRDLSSSKPLHGVRRYESYLLRSHDPGEREVQRGQVAAFLEMLPKLVTIESGQRLAARDAETRRILIGMFGQATAEAMDLGAQPGSVLWTDDLAVAYLAATKLGGDRVWSQLVLDHAASVGHVPTDVAIDLTLFLVTWRYFFTRVEGEHVLEACRRCRWDHKATPLAMVIAWFAAPEVIPRAVVRVLGQSIRLIWQHAVLPHQQEEVTHALIRSVLQRRDGRELVRILHELLGAIFPVEILAADRCRTIIRAALEGATEEGIIVPDWKNAAF
jgi:tetratricopeptide (TPR) repeat protein